MSDHKLDNDLIKYFSDARLRPARLEEILQETVELQRVSADSRADSPESVIRGSRPVGAFRTRLSSFLSLSRDIHPLVIALPSFVALAIVIALLLRVPDDGNQTAVAENAVAPLLLSDLVFKEAALNHRSKFKYDVVAADVDSIVEGMHRLDFDVELPDALASGFELVGGRYCTLGGYLAAHIRLQERAASVMYDKVDGHVSYNLPFSELNDAAPGTLDGSVSLFQPRSRSLFVTRTGPEFNDADDLKVAVHDDVSVQSWTKDGLLYVLAEGGIEVSSVQ